MSESVFMSARQALVRLPIVQRQLDRDAGLNTAGFITGYRGSPLGGYDSALWQARPELDANDIVFKPGLNEDLAAIAVSGTQQIGFIPGRKVDGVFSIWYGKGPGVDRSGDPLKHANMLGVESNGGVLLVFGDDHPGKSSSVAHQSDRALAAHDIPVLYPASVGEIIEFGLAGFAMSRYSGLLVGLKLVNETADASAAFVLDSRRRFVMPDLPEALGDVHIRKELYAVQQQDVRVIRRKVPRALAFARANRLDRIALGAAAGRFVIVTAGKAYADVMDALSLLGIDEPAAQAIGLTVYKVAMISPLEPEGLREVAAAAQELLIVEEKRPVMESQIARILINVPRPPRVSGKTDPDGAPLVVADNQLDACGVALVIARRLSVVVPDIADRVTGFSARSADLAARLERAEVASGVGLMRRPAFCPGCPHSTSTVVPKDSVGMTGIGCHAMAMFHADRNPMPVSHMGGEGGAWLGMAPFTSTRHVFQNLGDGTYSHSGSMAVRAAVQAGVNITYKILVNDVVAMTGGQPVEGGLSVGRIAAQMLAEGVVKVVVVSELPSKWAGSNELPRGVATFAREELDAVQRRLREIPGVTVLIYDQTCAMEKRRLRKRKQVVEPPERVFINAAVCEGCGDCSTQSNCLAVQPLETELGRKRTIDQAACNKDTSCLKGFCPSFVTVKGVQSRKPARTSAAEFLADLPEPAVPALECRFDLLIAGIGGTGVVTLSTLLGRAAHLEGRGVSLYDMTGLSQKGGAVYSHVRISADPADVAPARVGVEQASVLLACDLVAAIQAESLQTVADRRTHIVANNNVTATAAFTVNPDLDLTAGRLLDALGQRSGREPLVLAATALAERFVGDPIAANTILLGHAWQLGLIPLAKASIVRSIELGAVAVAANLLAFEVGRAAAIHSPQRMLAASAVLAAAPTLDEFVGRRITDLRAYWNERYAQRYADLVAGVRSAEQALGVGDKLTWAVARGAFKLMAYKDEYEVGRLYSDGRFLAELKSQFEGAPQLAFHLAPPLLTRADPRTGRPRKVRLGAWTMALFRVLASSRGLRETAFDVFGRTHERRVERQLRDAYLAAIGRLVSGLDHSNHQQALAIAEAAMGVRGFGPVKARAADDLLAMLQAS